MKNKKNSQRGGHIETKNNYAGTINIGLQKGYTGTYFEKDDYISYITKWQLERTADRKLMFSPAVYEFDFVCGNLTEKHLAIRFINFPREQVTGKEFRKILKDLAESMADAFEQNRILIEFSDRNVLIEREDCVDYKTA